MSGHLLNHDLVVTAGSLDVRKDCAFPDALLNYLGLRPEVGAEPRFILLTQRKAVGLPHIGRRSR